VTLRFSDLNPLGRAIIVVVAALTFGVAAVSFATSYGALYAYARDTGLYSDRLTRLWPLLLDGAFIVAQLAAILAGILRGSRSWPILTMLLTAPSPSGSTCNTPAPIPVAAWPLPCRRC
jgi:hypothetical protein